LSETWNREGASPHPVEALAETGLHALDFIARCACGAGAGAARLAVSPSRQGSGVWGRRRGDNSFTRFKAQNDSHLGKWHSVLTTKSMSLSASESVQEFAPSGQDNGTHDSHTPHGGYSAKDSAERAATRRVGGERAGRDCLGRPAVVWPVYFGTWEADGSRASPVNIAEDPGGTTVGAVVPGRRGPRQC